MAGKTGTRKGSGSKRRKLTHFFWDQRLHKVIRINRPANLVDAWDYGARKRVSIFYPDFRIKAKPAVKVSEAARIMRLDIKTIKKAIYEGQIHEPDVSYPLDKNALYRTTRWFGEHNLLELHDYLLTVHIGRPRKDGMVTPSSKLPTRAEIIAKMNNDTTLYIQGDDGSFVPLYDPPKF